MKIYPRCLRLWVVQIDNPRATDASSFFCMTRRFCPTPLHATRKRCAVLQMFHFPSSASWQGDPLARPRCIPSAIGAAQASSLHAPANRCAGRSRVRVMAPDTRQPEGRSCSSDTSMTRGDFGSPSDTHRPILRIGYVNPIVTIPFRADTLSTL